MNATVSDVVFRDGVAADATAVAALHAASWRAHYRGAASDAYLDGPVEAERQAFWARRLAVLRPERILVLAETGSRLDGFVCAITDQDSRWGSLIDNLHVAVALKRGGLGRALMREVATRLRDKAPGQPVHLFVLDTNTAARAFYDRVGGEAVAREHHALPDGSERPVTRIAWSSPRHLLDGAERSETMKARTR